MTNDPWCWWYWPVRLILSMGTVGLITWWLGVPLPAIWLGLGIMFVLEVRDTHTEWCAWCRRHPKCPTCGSRTCLWARSGHPATEE